MPLIKGEPKALRKDINIQALRFRLIPLTRLKRDDDVVLLVSIGEEEETYLVDSPVEFRGKYYPIKLSDVARLAQDVKRQLKSEAFALRIGRATFDENGDVNEYRPST